MSHADGFARSLHFSILNRKAVAAQSPGSRFAHPGNMIPQPRSGCSTEPRVALRAPWEHDSISSQPRRGCSAGTPPGFDLTVTLTQGARNATLGSAMERLRRKEEVQTIVTFAASS